MRADICITRVSYSHSLAEMKTSRVSALIYVLLFSQTIIYGDVIEMKVRPGDNITLHCDRPVNRYIAWIRNCSHEHQPSLIIDYNMIYRDTLQHFSFLKNPNINSFDLHITNITVSDLGLYYCAEHEKKVNKDDKGIIYSSDVYHYGNKKTQLSLAVSSGPFTTVSLPPPVSDCFLCWTLLVSVCVVCFLLCFICFYCLCQKKPTDGGTDHKEKIKSRNTSESNDDEEVCYASLEVKTRRQKRPKKKQQQSSDFSIYAPVRTDTIQNF
ncbi:uncharacterized protein [Paramisgurnus dabryanus]|uniref:uncharacterized protein n=1 Tax=Paramisgurnus dabryanus TaxID=90735 RepID=UPI0031F37CBB